MVRFPILLSRHFEPQNAGRILGGLQSFSELPAQESSCTVDRVSSYFERECCGWAGGRLVHIGAGAVLPIAPRDPAPGHLPREQPEPRQDTVITVKFATVGQGLGLGVRVMSEPKTACSLVRSLLTQ